VTISKTVKPKRKSVYDKILPLFWGRVRNIEKVTISFVMPVCLSVLLHVATWLPLEGFWLNLMFGDFSKICRENPSLIKILQEQPVRYMKTYSHL
jgi:hypothetical protein